MLVVFLSLSLTQYRLRSSTKLIWQRCSPKAFSDSCLEREGSPFSNSRAQTTLEYSIHSLAGWRGQEMFKKPPNVKNLSVLRSSDRKKIIQRIIQQFNLDNIDEEARNALLPDCAQVCIPLIIFADSFPLSLPNLQLILTRQESFTTTRKAFNLCGSGSFHHHSVRRC